MKDEKCRWRWFSPFDAGCAVLLETPPYRQAGLFIHHPSFFILAFDGNEP
jgi:hypothetical protein